ncbi:MAG: hypothetical protein Q4G40_12705, partial [Brachybacterium sp.]|nr:hypothetical protein [Brachybacterium sp.]
MQEAVFILTDSRGDVVLKASSRELDPTAEYWIDGTPTGWIGGFSMDGENVKRLGHGEFHTSRTRTGRTLEVRAKIHLSTWEEGNAVKRHLSSALGDGEAGTLTGRESGVPELSATVERTGEVLVARVSPTTFTVSIPLLAPDPCLYGETQVIFLHPIGTGVGMEYPLYGPVSDPDGEPVISYGTAIESQDPIANPGNAAAWPTFLVTGDFPSGFQIR